MKKSMLLFCVLLFSVSLFAEGNRESGGGNDGTAVVTHSKTVITDSTGNTASLTGIPQRIVYAGRASIMVSDALYMFSEAAERIVGVGLTNQGRGNFIKAIDPKYNQKINLGRSVGVEQIASGTPDLVILKDYLKKSVGAPVARLGIPVLYLNLETPNQYRADIAMLGRVFNDTKRAEEINKYYKNMQETITARTAGLKKKPDVLFLYHSSRDGKVAFNIPPKSWIQTRMIEIAGGRPVWINSATGKGWTKVNLEQIAFWNPDQIYIVAYKQNEKEVVKEIKNSPLWKNLKAVKNNAVKAFPVDYYSWDQPDSRWILGTAWLATKIHPELFHDINIKSITKKFYKKLYFMSDSVYNREIRTRLGW